MVRRRVVLCVLLWQVATPFAMPAVATASVREAAACCTLARPAGACPMHAKAASDAARCHMRCSLADASPLVLLPVAATLPALAISLGASQQTATPDTAPAFVPSPLHGFDPPPPRG